MYVLSFCKTSDGLNLCLFCYSAKGHNDLTLCLFCHSAKRQRASSFLFRHSPKRQMASPFVCMFRHSAKCQMTPTIVCSVILLNLRWPHPLFIPLLCKTSDGLTLCMFRHSAKRQMASPFVCMFRDSAKCQMTSPFVCSVILPTQGRGGTQVRAVLDQDAVPRRPRHPGRL